MKNWILICICLIVLSSTAYGITFRETILNNDVETVLTITNNDLVHARRELGQAINIEGFLDGMWKVFPLVWWLL